MPYILLQKGDSKKKSQKAEVRVNMNSRAMLSEMERMGAGLVTAIDVFAK